MHRRLPGFSRAKCDAIKSNQCPHSELDTFWALLRGIQVNLRNFVAAHVAGVRYMHGDVQAAIRCSRHTKVGIAEGAVGKPVSKGKQWLNLLLVEPAIAYIQTLRESRFALHALSRALRMDGVGRWIVFKTPTPRKTQ